MEYFDKKLEEVYQPDIEFFSFNLIRPLVQEKASKFFYSREIKEFDLLSEKIIVSSIFFKKIDFHDYFYSEIFRDIHKNKFNVKYSVTINSSLTDQYCDKTDTKFSTINLNSEPVLYYIFLPIEEITSI